MREKRKDGSPSHGFLLDRDVSRSFRCISERTRAGVKAAKTHGLKFGRKSKLTPKQIDHARKLIDGGKDGQKAAESLEAAAKPERRLPQDGRINLELDAQAIDVRVATIPSVARESVSLRPLGQEKFTFERLGLDEDAQLRVRALLALPVSDHFEPASNYRNDPVIKNCVSRHFSSKRARCNSLVSGLFERTNALPFRKHLTQNPLAGSFR